MSICYQVLINLQIYSLRIFRCQRTSSNNVQILELTLDCRAKAGPVIFRYIVPGFLLKRQKLYVGFVLYWERRRRFT